MSEIWAVLEQREGAFHEQSGELLAELADIARRQQDQTALCAVVLDSPDMPSLDATLLTRLGVQRLYLVEHPQLASYTTDGYVSALAWLLQQHTPLLVVTGATADGRDWMPRLAAKLRLPFVSSCLGLDLHNHALFALRSLYEGRAYIQTRTTLHGRTGLATLLAEVRGTPMQAQGPHPSLQTVRLTPDITVGKGLPTSQHLLVFWARLWARRGWLLTRAGLSMHARSAQPVRVCDQSSTSPVASLAPPSTRAACARHTR